MCYEHQWHTRLCLVCHFWFLPRFNFICDLLLHRRAATRNPFVNCFFDWSNNMQEFLQYLWSELDTNRCIAA